MWKNRCASIKDDPVNPALIKSVQRGCVRVEKTEGVCVCQYHWKPLASIMTSLGRNEGWTCPHHKIPLVLQSVNDINM